MNHFKGKQFQQDVIIVAVGHHLRYNLSYREVQEILYDRGINVSHMTIYRWVQEYGKLLFELPVIKITGITSRDYITYTILIVHAPNLVIMTGNTTIMLNYIIFTNYRTRFDSLRVIRIILCY